MKISKTFILIVSVLVTCISCNYSFTGASISPEVRSVSVGYFKNLAPLVNPTLSQSFTDALKDKFTSQTNLILKDRDGDLQFEGEIVDYYTQPIAIQGNDVAALNRLSITVKVKFLNRFDQKLSFEQNFTRFEDYNSKENFKNVEDNLVKSINNALIEDIFNKAVVNW